MIVLLSTLALLGMMLLAAGPMLRASGIDVIAMQDKLTSDGQFDAATRYAIGALPAGMLWAGVALLALACALWWLRQRDRIAWGSDRAFLAILTAVQATVALIYVTQVHVVPFNDFIWYHNQAVNIVEGRGVISYEGAPTAYWPAGLPFLLAAVYAITGPSLLVARLLNIAMVAGITLMTWALARRLLGPRAARLAALLIAILPSQVLWCSLPTADMLFTVLCLGMLVVVARAPTWRTALAAGVLYGAATLVRPVIYFIPPLLLLYWLLASTPWRKAVALTVLLFAAGSAVLLPWQIRNYRIFGEFVLVSTNGGVHLWMGNNPRASGGFIPETDFITPEGKYIMSSLNEARRDRWAGEQGKAYLRENPAHCLSLWPKKVVHLFYRDSKCVTYPFRETFQEVHPALIAALILISEGVYYALGLAFIVGLFGLARAEGLSARVWLGAGMLLYFVGIYLPFITEGRYHMPLLPIFAVFAAAAARSRPASGA